jgi:SAM-dependent methyltransferase
MALLMSELGSYFENIWAPNTDQYKYSGWALLDKIKEDESILDVGCGYNLFKPHFGDRLIGIDPYNDAADFRVSIEEFESAVLFDAVFCLGSINFGDEETILQQIEKVVSLVKPGGRIYWRQNPGRQDHNNEECKKINFFNWTFDRNLSYSRSYKCDVQLIAWDSGRRIYSEWTKNYK